MMMVMRMCGVCVCGVCVCVVCVVDAAAPRGHTHPKTALESVRAQGGVCSNGSLRDGTCTAPAHDATLLSLSLLSLLSLHRVP